MWLLKNTIGVGNGWLIGGSRKLVPGEKVDHYSLVSDLVEEEDIILTESGAIITWEDQELPVPDGVEFEDLVFVFVGSWWALASMDDVSSPDEDDEWEALDDLPTGPRGLVGKRGFENVAADEMPKQTLRDYLVAGGI